MGNHVARNISNSTKKTDAVTNNSNALTTNTVSRSSSGNDIEHSSPTQFFPIDNLAKILSHLTYEEKHVHGITMSVFEKYLFPNYPTLAEKLFTYLHHSAEASTPHLTVSAFKQQSEKFLSVMSDQTILENYVTIYSNIKDGDICPDLLRSLLMTCYQLAMDSTGTTTCIYIHRVVNAVVISCVSKIIDECLWLFQFHGKDSLSVSYVSNWMWQHCSRIVHGLHCYVVHVLTTAYRNGKALLSKEQPQPHLEIPTPVLERADCFDQPQALLPVSYVWLLSTTLPQCYLQANDTPKDITHAIIARTTGNICPRHWTLLYNSSEHGAGANRFLHHVLGYRGPTLLFVKAADPEKDGEYFMYCMCSAVEWRESHLYWGDEDSVGIQLSPFYRVIEKGPKVLYLNTGIRGYPHGLRFGSNPRSPHISIDESFHSVSIAGAPYPIATLEVWGCGDVKLRERQLDIKKWQVKEAERQRIVKLSASDWLDHPDRYLLELAGRASYNESNK
ncbi:restriction of telomere capping protein 5 [Vespula squamosa]|uniref:Restriction of telomere capping protein 5 n=1 Tax=Vespula squamosa TaxID=30214 RepID=A0ABD2B1S3_VESSQ